jgi:Lrp/AsnC family transcriptional regulator, regulator for asnA, asnC and gidA
MLTMLDDKDSKILAMLVRDGRRPVVEIARETGLPRATAQERLKRLVRTGVVKKFTVMPDYSKLGKEVLAYVLVSFSREGNISQRTLAEEMAKMPEVYEIALISGEWDMMLKVRGSSVQEIGRLVVDRLRMMKGIEKTQTCLSFQTIKEIP